MITRIAMLSGAPWVLAALLSLVSMPSHAFKWPWQPPPELVSTADFINQRAPYVADGIGVLQSYGPVAVTGAKAKGRTLNIDLRLLSPIKPEFLKFEVFYIPAAGAAREMCELSTTLEMLLKDQYTRLRYSDVAGKFIVEISVDREFCGFN